MTLNDDSHYKAAQSATYAFNYALRLLAPRQRLLAAKLLLKTIQDYIEKLEKEL